MEILNAAAEIKFKFKWLPKPGKGHMPWTEEQLAAAASKFTGVMRRGFLLYQHTGLRGSDVVRLGPTDVDTYQGRDAFALTTQKRKRDVWCPIMPTLAAEMATWERRPGPYLLQQNGKPFTRRNSRGSSPRRAMRSPN
jgi:integrase